MINLAVINLKVLIRRILKSIIIIFMLIIIVKFVSVFYDKIKKFDINNFSSIRIIQNNFSVSSSFNVKKENKESTLKKVLIAEFAAFTGTEVSNEENGNQEVILETEKVEDITESKDMQLVENFEKIESEEQNQDKNVQTMIIENNNKKDVYTDNYKSVQIKNESKYSLTEDILTPDVNYSNKDIIIYHTHTCESYTPTAEMQYEATGNYRTTDLDYSVARVGTELADELEKKGYKVNHDITCHDYPAYTGSYTRALSTITNLLSNNKEVDAVFDIHRDALRK